MTEAIWPSKPKYLQSWPFTEKAGPQIRASVTITLESISRWSGLVSALAAVTRLPRPVVLPRGLGSWMLGATAAQALGGEEGAHLPFLGAS